MERVLDEKGYSVYLANCAEDPAKQRRLLAHLAEYNVEGVLLCPARGTTADDLAGVTRRALPCVLVARYLSGVTLDYVGADNRLGARLATEHLVGCGHRRIAFIGGPLASSARRDRIAGYRAALKTAGLAFREDLAVVSEVTREGGRQCIRELLALRSPPTAAVCYNDVVAIGVMNGLAEVGIRPGAGFAVVGFDDIADAAQWVPPLSTVANPSRSIAETAAELLLRRLAAPRSARRFVTLKASLVVRDSSRPAGEAVPAPRPGDGPAAKPRNI
jgi:LacI family transcriptional regulator